MRSSMEIKRLATGWVAITGISGGVRPTPVRLWDARVRRRTGGRVARVRRIFDFRV